MKGWEGDRKRKRQTWRDGNGLQGRRGEEEDGREKERRRVEVKRGTTCLEELGR